MTKSFWVAGLMLPVLLWFSFHFVLQENYRIRQTYIENVIYEYTQIMAKAGTAKWKTLDNMYLKLENQGRFDTYISAEKVSQEVPVTISGLEVFERDLRGEGYEVLRLTVIFRGGHPLGTLYRRVFFLGGTSGVNEMNLGATSSAYLQ